MMVRFESDSTASYISNILCNVLIGIRRDHHLRFIASRRHVANFANSSLQASFLTSVYVATTHLPYAEACAEQVTVE